MKNDWEHIQREIQVLKKNSGLLKEFSPMLVQMLIAAEDHRFYKHQGFDIIAVVRAILKNFLMGRREGGSTIAMQFVRVLSGKYEKTLRRKGAEIILATRLTNLVGKDELPKLYLHVAYFGWRMNGIKSVFERLNLTGENLSPLDAALIVSRLKYPEPRNPSKKRLDKIRIRAEYVMRRADKLDSSAWFKKLGGYNGSV